MSDMVCPFCLDDGFDDVGLALHLGAGCRMYDLACRRASDYADRVAKEPGYKDSRAWKALEQNTKEPK